MAWDHKKSPLPSQDNLALTLLCTQRSYTIHVNTPSTNTSVQPPLHIQSEHDLVNTKPSRNQHNLITIFYRIQSIRRLPPSRHIRSSNVLSNLHMRKQHICPHKKISWPAMQQKTPQKTASLSPQVYMSYMCLSAHKSPWSNLLYQQHPNMTCQMNLSTTSRSNMTTLQPFNHK